MKNFVGYVQIYVKGTDKNGLVGTASWNSDFGMSNFDETMIKNLEEMFKESFSKTYACNNDTLEIEFIEKEEYDVLSGATIKNVSWGDNNE